MLQEQHNQAALPEAHLLQEQCSHAAELTRVLDAATLAWHREPIAPADLAQSLHAANFQLWHLEDQARDEHSGDAAVAATKRSIDRVNQQRNDLVEQIDEHLLALLQQRDLLNAAAPLHSETPGQILDRLSILSLKIFHTALEAERADVEQSHRERNRARLAALKEQQADLADCLSALWQAVNRGERRIKRYRQMKMYNDPALNPVIYLKDRSHRR